MKFSLSLLVLGLFAVHFAACASLPDTSDRKDNVVDAAPKGPEVDQGEGNTFPEDKEGEPFEIIVPVARNFSSLEELIQILREDDSKEPRVVTGAPATYVKGTERNSSEYLIFLTDGVGNNKGTSL